MTAGEPVATELTGLGGRLGEARLGPLHAGPAAGSAFEPPPGAAGLELRTRFTLERADHGAPFVAAHLVVGFDDPRVRVCEAAGEAPGLPMAISELPGGCGWLLGDPLGDVPIPLGGEARAVLCAPPELTVVSGFVRLDVTVLVGRGRPRRAHGGSPPVRFEVPPPEGWALDARPAPAEPVRTRSPAVRLCVAVDTESYSRFSTGEAARSQQRLVDVLARARRHAGLREADVDLQQSGDGQFAILPAGVDESAVIPRLVSAIRTELAATNADLNAHARLRLRVALHRGHVAAGVNGWVGSATIAVHRLLDSAPVRAALAREHDADFALIVSDVLYTDIITDGYGSLDPADFAPAEVRLPEKNFAESAWVYVPKS
ncbi:hypothetical protein SAMN05421837_110256 [Amycolatopsis pretoriensis]|uniref:Guanylate cyclase domain-containing protein n=1 Tax=Amycolatopsis pretoriensis TaxID=218821 RepID=A0A1H5RG70_9PSEU|nr:hypothetical protein [Amycolatopsis pretoriensis]SEF36501.1 hypothetical protein SAMN05421837_110256 [Amycolatopsis pretoriensis]